MNSAEAYRKLFAAFASGARDEFFKVAQEIIEDEERKHNNKLAKDLCRILYNGNKTKNYSERYKKALQIPRDAERGLPLVEIKECKKDWSEIVVEENIENTLRRIILENQKREVLEVSGLKPKMKLLFFGPPGCGKTLAAEVLSTVLSWPMAYVKFDGLISSYLGETASNMRKIFDFIERGQWVVFFDEFDAIGKERDSPFEHGEMKRVVNSFLQMLDNFKGESIIIAATNHQHLLDPALWRRFDELIYFGFPDKKRRVEIFKKYLRGIRTIKVDLEYFAEKTDGMSPADIETICLNAIKEVILSDKKSLTKAVLDEYVEKQRERIEIRNKAMRG
ncbi:MAG: AAA ATPase [Candidatus Syntrophoarchaeum caldarius]|uniref:AAA ATPase n=1 Tax=Candidatus Syntropharchaeum caldarium TaxID=1838285 RepID=A0A1F2P8J8_9EURY|nr:MAG: AAA ATPase [Candidatus Syntrophoarchaeum caldarius]